MAEKARREIPEADSGREKSAGSSIAVQAGILAIATIVVRIIGLLYRAPLTAIIGDEGNGYYGAAYNIYMIILILSSNSLPAAISRQMSTKIAVGEYRNAQRTFHCALIYSLVVGTAGSLLLYFGAGVLVKHNAVPVLRVFAPTVFLFGILGAVRGYFQANQSMVQTSVSQILEQIANAAVSIGAASLLIRTASIHADPTEKAVRGAMGSAMGTGIGVATALVFMVIAYLRHRKGFFRRIALDKGSTDPYARIMKSTILVVTPFIVSSFILNLTTTLDQMIYLNMLIDGRGLPEAAVTTVFGLFSNKAVVITNIPISVATAVSAAIIPNIATAYASGDLPETRRRSLNASRMALIISIPCAVGLLVLARPVTMLMFPQWETLELASVLLALQSVTVIFLSVGTITNAVLQAIGKMNMPIVSAGISLIIQTAALIFFLRFTDWGIYAMVFVSVLYAAIIFALNEMFLRHYLGLRFDAVKVYWKPVFSALVMGAAAFAVYRAVFLLASHVRGEYFANFVALIPAILTAVPVYFFILIRMGSFTEEDILGLPKGTAIARLLKKLHWM
jgi:stage V sporulation protein B